MTQYYAERYEHEIKSQMRLFSVGVSKLHQGKNLINVE